MIKKSRNLISCASIKTNKQKNNVGKCARVLKCNKTNEV